MTPYRIGDMVRLRPTVLAEADDDARRVLQAIVGLPLRIVSAESWNNRTRYSVRHQPAGAHDITVGPFGVTDLEPAEACA